MKGNINVQFRIHTCVSPVKRCFISEVSDKPYENSHRGEAILMWCLWKEQSFKYFLFCFENGKSAIMEKRKKLLKCRSVKHVAEMTTLETQEKFECSLFSKHCLKGWFSKKCIGDVETKRKELGISSSYKFLIPLGITKLSP